MRDAWSPTCPGHVPSKSHCEAGAVSLGAGVPLCGSSQLTWHPDCFPCSGKPHGHAPTVGQLVLRGALAKNNLADVRSPENRLQTSPKTATKTFPGKAGHSSLTHWFGPWASRITCVTERGLQSYEQGTWLAFQPCPGQGPGFLTNCAKPTPNTHTGRQAGPADAAHFCHVIPCKRIHRDLVVDGCFPAKGRLPERQ